MPNRRSLKAIFFTLAVLAGIVLCLAADRGQPTLYGIGNFGRVNDRLFRGAEPDSPAIKSLQQLGIKHIIDLRTTREVWAREAPKAADVGITYTNIPLKGLGRPTDEQVDHVLALI